MVKKTANIRSIRDACSVCLVREDEADLPARFTFFEQADWQPTALSWGPEPGAVASWQVWASVENDERLPIVFVLWLGDNRFEPWPMEALLANWSPRLSELCRRSLRAESSDKTDRRCAASASDIRSWLDLTRSLGTRYALGDEVPELMERAAAAVEQVTAYWTKRLTAPPGDDRGLARVAFDSDLWVLRAVLNDLQKHARTRLPHGRVRNALLSQVRMDIEGAAAAGQNLPEFYSSEALDQRVRRFSHRIRSDQRDGLIADTLALLRRPFLPTTLRRTH